MKEIIQKINDLAKTLPKTKIMEVCGGHTNTIMKYGILDILPKNIKLIAGPGCPVCVTCQKDIDSVIKLALNGIKISTYGDMLSVPGTKMSLDDARSQGADIKMILSAEEALKYPNHVFFAIGFETTTPMTAYLLKHGITVYSTHKTMPYAMKVLTETDSDLKGFIDPGHVSTIIGTSLWKSLNVPQVISGFKPEQMIRAIYKLLKLIKNNQNIVINDYPEAVKPEGNVKAKALVDEMMKPTHSEWRGLGVIPNSGLDPKNGNLNAKVLYSDLLKTVETKENEYCRCGDVIKGLIEPNKCPLFGDICTPSSPKGACMVSENEGACAIFHKFKSNSY